MLFKIYFLNSEISEFMDLLFIYKHVHIDLYIWIKPWILTNEYRIIICSDPGWKAILPHVPFSVELFCHMMLPFLWISDHFDFPRISVIQSHVYIFEIWKKYDRKLPYSVIPHTIQSSPIRLRKAFTSEESYHIIICFIIFLYIILRESRQR